MDFTALASKEAIESTIRNLKERNIDGMFVDTKEEALTKIKEWIPKGASVMNGSSTTLEQIGYIAYLKSGAHGWNNLHEAILAEKDPAKQALMRRQAVVSDFYLGSVHAAAQTGELVIASNTGSQMPHIVYTSSNLIFIVSTQKITPTLEDARQRLREHVVPLENQRMITAYGSGTHLSKELIFHYENPFLGRKVRVLFVGEKLGF
jgi:L-lactate utilization protein LutB